MSAAEETADNVDVLTRRMRLGPRDRRRLAQVLMREMTCTDIDVGDLREPSMRDFKARSDPRPNTVNR